MNRRSFINESLKAGLAAIALSTGLSRVSLSLVNDIEYIVTNYDYGYLKSITARFYKGGTQYRTALHGFDSSLNDQDIINLTSGYFRQYEAVI